MKLEPAYVLLVYEHSLLPPVRVRSDRLDMTRVEALRWRLHQQLGRIWERCEALAKEILAKGGEAHARASSGWRCYRTELAPTPDNPEWVTWLDRRVEEPTLPVHLELGQPLHDLYEYAFRSSGRRRQLAEAALKHCIARHLALVEPKAELSLRLRVNGRDYWYTSERFHHCFRWRKQLWPEDASVVVDLDERKNCQ